MTSTASADEAENDEGDPGLLHRLIEIAANENLLVVVTLVLGIFLLVVGRTLLGVDSWLTFMAGREIVDHGLPYREVLTTMPAGRTWTDQQWFAQLVFYGLFRAGGLGLAVAFHALMISTALAITMTASRVRGASSRMTLVAAIVCLVVAPWSWQLRAQSIALPLFALTLALISTDRHLKMRRTLLVFPTLVLWANVHGSVVLGALIVSLAALLAIVEIWRSSERTGFARPFGYLVLPWACVLASPYGTDLVGYYKLLLVDSPVSRYITEWQAPEPHGYFLAFFAVAAATVVVAVWQRRRLSLFDLLVLALTLAGAARSVRAVVWFSLALAMLLPVALDGIVRPSPSPPVHRRIAAILAGTLAATLAAVALFVLTRSDGWFEQGISSGAARAAARAAAADPGATIWAGGTYADWLLWKEPSLRGRIAWDARFELLTEKELRSVVLFNSHKPGWRVPARPYRLVVLDRGHNRRQVSDLERTTGIRVLFRDSSAIVFSR